MVLRKISGAAVLTTALALTACGGGPDIDQVRADFDNPSGSTKDKTGVLAANGKRDASESALRLTTGVPGASGGLTAAGKAHGLDKIAPRALWEQKLRSLYNQRMATEGRALRMAQDEEPIGGDDFGSGCQDSPEAQAAFQELVTDLGVDAANPLGGSTADASAEYTQDLASCSGGALTGTLEVAIEVELEEGKMRFAIEQGFVEVCEAEGAKTCINGTFIMEATMAGSGTGEDGSLEFLTAWELDATWTEDGAELSASTKGGIRMAVDNQMFGLEYLVYCKDSAGEEVSYVLRFQVNADGSMSLEYKGADGEMSCSVTSDGNGQCTGDSEMTWTDAEYDGVVESDDFED